MTGAMSAYRTVYIDLRRRIGKGEWKIGDQLPSIAELMQQYDIRSLNTIRAAQSRLVQEGLIRTRQGVGSFVTAIPSGRVGDHTIATESILERIGHIRMLLSEIESAVKATDPGFVGS